ncbi:sodium:solute symporter family protein [Bacillus sp. S3]|uniref:sodium:solute symporter family protein n=1 Tax=Bacillus sp. S3 TaxID=486398 RepID=UPI001189CBA9|nr:sodium:solute symporter family protein [Bacillus sp. S3]QCJ42547.1 sodium:solute symporter family protein [Bacillus sp. S3]
MNIYIIVFILYLLFLIVIGFLASKGQEDTADDYYVAGRSMNKWVVAGTYGASFMSAGTFIVQIGANYAAGWSQIWNFNATILPMFILAAFFAKKFWRIGYYYGARSMPDLIALRYPSKFTRGFYSLLILMIYTVGMAAMYLGIFTVLSLVTDLSYMTCIIIGAVVVLLYSYSGGAKAVAWTDTACLVLMIFAIVVSVSVALVKGGGFENLISAFGQASVPEGKPWAGGSELLSPTNSYFTLSMVISFFLVWTMGNLSQPHQMTRVYLAKDEKAAISGVALILIPNCIILIGGLIIGAYARVTYPNLDKIDYAFPTVVMGILPPLVAAIVLIGIIAAVMSTASTMLIISAQAAGYDIYKKLINQNASEKTVVKISRVTMIVCTVLSIIIAYFAQTVQGIFFLWSSAFAMMGAGVLPSLIGTFYWKRANSQACLASMIVGFGSTAAMYIFPSLKPLWAVHPILPGLILSVTAFILVALFTKKPDDDIIEMFFGEKLKDPSKRTKKAVRAVS